MAELAKEPPRLREKVLFETKEHSEMALNRLFEVPSTIDQVKQTIDLHQIAISHAVHCTNMGFRIPGSAGFANMAPPTLATTRFDH